MRGLLTFVLVAASLYPRAAFSVTQYSRSSYSDKGVSISLDDPIGSVYKEGEEVGFSIKTDTDAYVIVVDVDTDGFVHLLYPTRGNGVQRLSSDKVYRLPENTGEALAVGGSKGIEFVFAFAVENRDYINDQEIGFLEESDRVPEEKRFRITGDPFLGANRIASQLVRGISHRDGVTISFTYFYVGEAVDFPRYLCEDCYSKGKDPYSSGMPAYAASADFTRTERLIYPLEEGFVPASGYAEETALSTDAGGQASVTKVYVSYYPKWDNGFYDRPWWYYDPWYWDPWYAWPYAGVGFYVGWGWGGWGWGAWPYYYYPYYYPYYYCGGPYPYSWGCDPWYGSCGSGTAYASWRSLRPVGKGGGANTLHTAMTYPASRDLRARSLKPSDMSDRLRVTPKRSSGGLQFAAASPTHRIKDAMDVRVIRSRPTASQKSGAANGGREIRGKKTSYREQRVITRSSTPGSRTYTGSGTRSGTRTQIERMVSPGVRRVTEPRRTQSGVTPKTVRPRTESRGSYTPNVRREGSSRSVSPPSRGTSGRSSGAGSSYRGSSSGRSSGGGSSNRGGGSSSRTRR